MTAKEFVRQYLPTAQSERVVSGKVKGFSEVHYLIRQRGHYMYFASGKSESNAWVNAKKKIIELKMELPYFKK